MDDFGTGHSSLASLHRFPIDVLKIDRQFITTMSLNREYAAVIHAIITLADNLGMRVVAEGIETIEGLTLLQAMSCDYGQGYYLSVPLEADDASKLLSSKACTLGLPQWSDAIAS
jgi:EAL domain-containing protein (putative c-di-GMP-specific phosphodiesterase class I)